MSDNQNLPATGGNQYPEAAPPTFLPAREPIVPEEAAAASGGTRRYVAALLRYKWIILLIGIGGSVAGYFATGLMPKSYVAEARLIIEVTDRNNTMRGPIQPSELLSQYAWVELIRSWAVLDHVVAQERLYLDYHPRDAGFMKSFTVDTLYRPGSFVLKIGEDGRSAELRTSEGVVVERVEAGAAIGTRLGFLWQPPPDEFQPRREIAFDVLVFRDASKRMADKLLTTLTGQGSFMAVEYSGPDPERVASVVNAVSDRFVGVATELKKAKLLELRKILKSQLDAAEISLAENERALEAFRVETITLPTDGGPPVTAGTEATRQPVLNSYFELKIDRDMLQRDRDMIQRLLAGSGGDTLSVDALSAVRAVQEAPELTQALMLLANKRAELRALSRTYTDEHTLVRKAAAEVNDFERRVVPQLAGQVIVDLGARMAVLDDLINSASKDLREIPVRASDEGRLRRMMAIANNTYNDLRQRYENARLAADATVPDVRVLDSATVPRQPAGDTRLRLLLMAVAGSFGAAVALAILLDRVDPRLRYPEQITYGMRLPILGALPHMSSKKRAVFGGAEVVQVVESLRSIRLSVANAYGSSGPLILTISSPGSGDGKTFLTSNLASTFGEVGSRTLVMDADLRRGDAHHLFDLDRKPGLSDYLSGKCSMNEIVRKTANERLDVIPCGMRLSNAPELLSSARMGHLLAHVKSEYDVILIDSPPLGAGVDPLILATLSGHVILVMRNGKTDRALAESKLEQIDRLPVRLLGAILNDVDSSGVYRYYSYLPGYEASSEEDAPKALQPV